jgi:hypothetical protein
LLFQLYRRYVGLLFRSKACVAVAQTHDRAAGLHVIHNVLHLPVGQIAEAQQHHHQAGAITF